MFSQKKIAFDEISAIVQCCGCSVPCFCLPFRKNKLDVLHLANIFFRRCFASSGFFSLLALTNPSGCLFEKFGTWSSRRWSAVYIAKYKNTATAFFAQAHSKNSPLKQISRLVVFRFFQCKTSFTFKLNLLVSISPLFFALFLVGVLYPAYLAMIFVYFCGWSVI